MKLNNEISQLKIDNPVGLHVIAEYSACDLSSFCLEENYAEQISSQWVQFLEEIGVTTLGRHIHFFGPNSLSMSLNLSESHLNFHSWPEFNYVALDFFCCKKSSTLKEEMESVLRKGTELFRSKSLKSIWVSREFVVS